LRIWFGCSTGSWFTSNEIIIYRPSLAFRHIEKNIAEKNRVKTCPKSLNITVKFLHQDVGWAIEQNRALTDIK
jgi:hypothetical protein